MLSIIVVLFSLMIYMVDSGDIATFAIRLGATNKKQQQQLYATLGDLIQWSQIVLKTK